MFRGKKYQDAAKQIEKNKVRVIVSMFGRETPVELELDQVELVND